MRIGLLTVTLAALLAALCGCHSDLYYQDRAVNRAREYLIKNAPELTAEEVYFVKYTKPKLLTSDVLSGTVTSTQINPVLTSGQRQVCVTWEIPGRSDLYLVFGVSSGRMDYWYPNRLIRKNFVVSSYPVNSAIALARNYVVQNYQTWLSPTEYNNVRFNNPWIIHTKFPLSIDPMGSLPPEQYEQKKQLLEKATQYSLVWKESDDARQVIVACGTSQPNIVGWTINFVDIMEVKELEGATLKVVRPPTIEDTAISLDEQAVEEPKK